MTTNDVAEMSRLGVYVGGGIALVPATVTLLIASSRTILINVIANTILSVLSAGTLKINIAYFYEISLIQVPLLWKISMISAVVGGSIVALSLIVALVNELYIRVFAKKKF